MEEFIDAVFKDDSPLNTVNTIRSILRTNGIEIEESWHETKVPYCYSLSLSIKGINFSTSGKGLSREFALASAYGEMIERVQLGYLSSKATQKDGSYSSNNGQDVKVPIKQLLDENIEIYQKMSERLLKWNGKELSAEEILSQYASKEGDVSATPFVSLIDGKLVYLPSKIRRASYATNGCAAGNTIEEAIVQALSEIVERFYRLRIIKENLCAPQIPDEVLQKYETAYKIIEYIRSQGYRVWVKDCSLGDGFPVLCVCFVHKATGKYHTHFGAYPIFEIALTRALTETFQGRSVDSFAEYSDFFYSKEEKDFLYNISQELIYGTAKRLPEFFIGEKDISYDKDSGFTGKTNKELLKECISFFKNQGYNILVRNASCLGFPTVQVIIPGYSEAYVHRLAKDMDDNRYLEHAFKVSRNPSSASMSDLIGFLMHNVERSKFVSHYNKGGFLAGAKIMAGIPKEQELFYQLATTAYVYFTMGKYAAASKSIGDMIKLNNGFKEELLICIKRYLDLTLKEINSDKIEELLRQFHSAETVALFLDYINNGKNPLDEFVLHCDMRCEDSCILKSSCCQKTAEKIVTLINDKTKELDINSFCDSINSLIF